MYNQDRDAIFLANQKDRFQKLANISPDAAINYRGWDRKQFTLEQALSQTIKGLTDHCYKLLHPIPANFLVTCGQHIDCVKDINENSNFSLLEKAEMLTQYLTCLSDIITYGNLDNSFSTMISITKGKMIK